jgi:cyclic beta-1,2-glucan synthetase
MYRVGLESILGLKRRGQVFAIDPCIPSTWSEFDISLRVGSTRYEIHVENPNRRCGGVAVATLDGESADPASIPISSDGLTHAVQIVLGDRTPQAQTRAARKPERVTTR